MLDNRNENGELDAELTTLFCQQPHPEQSVGNDVFAVLFGDNILGNQTFK